MKENIKFYLNRMRPALYYNFACVCCGKTIQRGELMIECPDCGAIFCKECVEDEKYENHVCQDYNSDCEYTASIKEAQTGKYLIEERDGKYSLGKESERILFYDEAEAESILAMLNDTTDLLFVLVDENK